MRNRDLQKEPKCLENVGGNDPLGPFADNGAKEMHVFLAIAFSVFMPTYHMQ